MAMNRKIIRPYLDGRVTTHGLSLVNGDLVDTAHQSAGVAYKVELKNLFNADINYVYVATGNALVGDLTTTSFTLLFDGTMHHAPAQQASFNEDYSRPLPTALDETHIDVHAYSAEGEHYPFKLKLRIAGGRGHMQGPKADEDGFLIDTQGEYLLEANGRPLRFASSIRTLTTLMKLPEGETDPSQMYAVVGGDGLTSELYRNRDDAARMILGDDAGPIAIPGLGELLEWYDQDETPA